MLSATSTFAEVVNSVGDQTVLLTLLLLYKWNLEDKTKYTITTFYP